MLRPDLDGLILSDREQNNLFLIFEGKSHLISSNDVAEALFNNMKINNNEYKDIEKGLDLCSGTCLLQSKEQSSIYLLAVYQYSVKKHYIIDYETFLEFGFSMDKVIKFPDLVLGLIPDGCQISGAMSRIGRHY